LLALHHRGLLAESVDPPAICELPIWQVPQAQVPLRHTPALGQAAGPAAVMAAAAAEAAAAAGGGGGGAAAAPLLPRLLQMTALPQC
jgi:hypothetical protein